MAGAMTLVNYISDDGATYLLRMDAGNATAVGNPAGTADVGLPGRHRPRYILATHPTTGRQRKLVISDPANALWTANSSTLNIEQFGTSPSTTDAHQVRSRVGEKRYRA